MLGNAGARLWLVCSYATPEQVRFVGVAEATIPSRRQKFAEEHDIDDAHCFASWEELIAQGAWGRRDCDNDGSNACARTDDCGNGSWL